MLAMEGAPRRPGRWQCRARGSVEARGPRLHLRGEGPCSPPRGTGCLGRKGQPARDDRQHPAEPAPVSLRALSARTLAVRGRVRQTTCGDQAAPRQGRLGEGLRSSGQVRPWKPGWPRLMSASDPPCTTLAQKETWEKVLAGPAAFATLRSVRKQPLGSGSRGLDSGPGSGALWPQTRHLTSLSICLKA